MKRYYFFKAVIQFARSSLRLAVGAIKAEFQVSQKFTLAGSVATLSNLTVFHS